MAKNIKNTSKTRIIDLTYAAIFATFISVCAWISIPMPVPFTLQTFGVFAAILFLGGKRATISVLIYILLGAVGVPVFSGFKGGLGVLLNATGGYIAGFLILTLAYWLITTIFGEKPFVKITAAAVGMVCCYIAGTMWFFIIYTKNAKTASIMTILKLCVFPFLLFDIVKLILAYILSKKLSFLIK